MGSMEKSRVTRVPQDKFIAVYHMYNGVLCHVAEHLHMNHRTVKKRARGLEPYPYLSIPEAARQLDIPRSTLEHWVQTKKFPTVQVIEKKNQRHMITEQAIKDFKGGLITISRTQHEIEPGYISVTEAAQRLNYCVAMIRRKCAQGKLPAKKNPHGVWMVKDVAI